MALILFLHHPCCSAQPQYFSCIEEGKMRSLHVTVLKHFSCQKPRRAKSLEAVSQTFWGNTLGNPENNPQTSSDSHRKHITLLMLDVQGDMLDVYMELRWSLRSPPTHVILWFYDMSIFCIPILHLLPRPRMLIWSQSLHYSNMWYNCRRGAVFRLLKNCFCLKS